MQRIIMVLLLFFCANDLLAQKSGVFPAIINGRDTLPHVLLEEVTVRGKAKYIRHYNRLTRLEYNVRKVYPYACMATVKISKIEQKLAQANSEPERKRIIREEYSQLMKTFKAPLMKLSVTQGRILIRLIYRETGHSSFAHIREYRGAVNAYFWQSIALLFGNNLKAAYDPNGEDAEIESIVQKIIQERQK